MTTPPPWTALLARRPRTLRPLPGASDAGATVAAAPFVPAEPQWRPVPVEGVRHGADVLRGLGMLPEDCQIEYRENVMEQVPAEEVAAAAAEQAAAVAAAAEAAGAGQTASFQPVEAEVTTAAPAAPAEPELGATAEVPVVTGEDLTATGRFNLVSDAPSPCRPATATPRASPPWATPTPPSPRLPRSASVRPLPETGVGPHQLPPRRPQPRAPRLLLTCPTRARSPWTRLPRTRAARL